MDAEFIATEMQGELRVVRIGVESEAVLFHHVHEISHVQNEQ